jgi:hypothetical protein
MAFESIRHTWPGVEAGADLSAGQFLAVVLNASGQAVLAGAGARVLGILQNKPDAAGKAATVSGPGATTKMVAGAAVALGADVTSNASGQAVTSASGNYIIGQCRTAAANSGELITVYVTQPGRTA